MSTYRTCLVLICCLIISADCLHLKGAWHSRDFFKFLVKFGFQQTVHEQEESEGYIYGNVTSTDNVTHPMALVVVDSEYFLYYFGNRSLFPRTKACELMFKKIDSIAWDEQCNANGVQDFIRHIPCPQNDVCPDETNPQVVLPYWQFTYRVRDVNQPRFWYLSFVSCYRETPLCKWTHDPGRQDFVLNYDIWLVNGRPDQKTNNPLEHQFSFELHDTVELYAAFAVIYTLLLPVQLYAVSIQRHPLPLLLTGCMVLEYLGVLLNVIHSAKFAVDGTGVAALRVVGNFIDMASQCCFMLLLLLIVKGWTITRQYLHWQTKLVLFSVWGAYTAASTALFVWNQVEVDLISDIDEYQTWPGWLILTFRLLIMCWFLVELRGTFLREHNILKTKFYLHFGAGFLVWFVYLPLLTLVCSQVSSLWRYKTIVSVSYSADLLSLCVLVHLLWPSRAGQLVFNLDRPNSRVDLSFAGMTLQKAPSESSDDFDDIYDSTFELEPRLSTRPSLDPRGTTRS